MTLLNRPDNGHVALMIVLWRTLRALGPMSKEQLEALCGYRGQEMKSLPVLGATIATWKTLGMIGNDGENLCLNAPFDTIASDDIQDLRTRVLEQLLKPENCPGLQPDDKTAEEASRASDFVTVAAWALSQDPYALASLAKGDKMEEEEGSEANLVLKLAQSQGIDKLWAGSAGRWVAFLEWADFCGLGMPTLHGFVMNPARAIRAVLSTKRATLGEGREILFTDFMATLSEQIPLLEGGTYRLEIDRRIHKKESLWTRQISPCTSLALLQLEHEGEIFRITRAGDTAPRFTLLGRGAEPMETPLTHIRIDKPHFTVAAADGASHA